MSKCSILRGHTSPETAYLVDDYPYGFRLRCKIRYWLEHKIGYGHRLVSQTSNPKVAGEPWNQPKASTYGSGLAFMFLDEQGHVQWTHFDCYSHAGQNFADFRAKWGDQLNAAELATLNLLETMSRRINPESWAAWDAAQAPKANREK